MPPIWVFLMFWVRSIGAACNVGLIIYTINKILLLIQPPLHMIEHICQKLLACHNKRHENLTVHILYDLWIFY